MDHPTALGLKYLVQRAMPHLPSYGASLPYLASQC